ncbi:FAD-binding oxidoreductase [Cryptosporangium phraense]|uniref:FAD-binding oxidoreductase n=1 Tax=Cryptosporangium phraense TaxID=2593070 RepID=A0A545AEJ3_9ACTN|nr:FAD-binding protein [Cryptosporangium phraense]TQS39690.1 FAD-binding oxidoreductase [Cryptosporangium phraense]
MTTLSKQVKIFRPGDPNYEQARGAQRRPAAIAFPRSPAEAAAVIRRARAEGWRVTSELPEGDLSDTVLVQTDYLSAFDFNRRVARLGAGATWGPLVDALGERGLAVLHGAARSRVVGHALRGGLGWYGRALGLASSTVAAVELVTADGELVRTDEDHEVALFWALRGGGGDNFGLVTAVELRLEWIRTVYAGMLAWDLRDAERVLPRWADWASAAPDAVTTVYRQIRRRDLVVVDGAVLAEDREAEAMLAGLRALRPKVDTFGRVAAGSLGDWPASTSDRCALRSDVPLDGSAVEVWQLGGALGRSAVGAGALDRLDGRFLVSGDVGGRTYLPFVRERVDPASGFAAEVWPLLQQIRRRVDPDGVFRAVHEIPV